MTKMDGIRRYAVLAAWSEEDDIELTKEQVDAILATWSEEDDIELTRAKLAIVPLIVEDEEPQPLTKEEAQAHAQAQGLDATIEEFILAATRDPQLILQELNRIEDLALLARIMELARDAVDYPPISAWYSECLKRAAIRYASRGGSCARP